jgi:hypothetical protein
MKKMTCLTLICAFLAFSQYAFVPNAAAQQDPQTTGEYLKKAAKDQAAETAEDIVKKKAQEKAEKMAPQLISRAYEKYPVIAKFSGRKDFSELMKDYNKYSDAYEKLNTVNSLLVKVAEGNVAGASYDATKEIFTRFFPYSKYIFSYLEVWDKMLTSVSDAVMENNLDYIRKEFMRDVLPKCKESCPLSDEQSFARRIGERMSQDDQGAYGLVAWYCKEGGAAGSSKCGSICVAGPFDWSKRRSFENSGCEDYAVMSFVRSDQKIRAAVSAHYLLLQAIEDVGDMRKALKNASDYVKKNLLVYEQEQEKIIAAHEALKEQQKKASVEKIAMAEPPTQCDEKCAQRYREAWQKTGEISQEIEKRRNAIHSSVQEIQKENAARRNELKINISSGSVDELKTDPGNVSIDEDNVDYNGRQAQRLEQLVTNAEKWLQSRQLEIRVYDERLSGLQGLSGLYAQKQSLETQYGTGGTYRSSAKFTANYSLILENEIKGVELKKQELVDEITVVQNNLSSYRALQGKYQSAFEEGSKKAREVLEKEIEPAYQEYAQADRELENVENERSQYEQEKLVQINVVMSKIAAAKNQAELEALLPQVNKDMAEYNRLLQKQAELTQKAADKRQKVEAVSGSSKIQRAKSTLGYKSRSMSSRMVRADLSGSKFSLAAYLPYFAQANRYVVTESTRRYDETLKKIPDEATFILMPESDLKKLSGEVSSATGENAVRDIKAQASNIAKIKDFTGAYSAHQTNLGSHTQYGDWKIDAVLSEEARTAVTKLTSFWNLHFNPLLQKRSQKMKEKITYSNPKIGSTAQEVHGAVRLTASDIANGVVPFQITASGWGIAHASVRVAAEEKNLPLTVKTLTAGDTPEAVYTAMVPVAAGKETHISYTVGDWTYSVQLQSPAGAGVSQEDIGKIRAFYDKFKQEYESRNDSRIVSMISDNWQAGDGSTLADLQVNLRRTFRVFDEIRYNIQNLSVTPGQDGRYNVSYDVTITSKIYKRNLKHEEKSSIHEEVTIDRFGKTKISKTLGGKFWTVQ